MKKNNSYLANDEINLSDLIRLLAREKILILSVSIICGFFSYLYISFQPQEFKIERLIKNPPSQLFEPYNEVFNININNNTNASTNFITNNNSNNINNNNNTVSGQFISDFKLNLLSLDNLESFFKESKEFDNFKEYLKSRNISAKNYFDGRINELKEKNLISSNKYFLVFSKELDGELFFDNYLEFVKKKTVFLIKKNIKLAIENKISMHTNALEKAKLINLENPLIKSAISQQVVNEPGDLFYKGTKILSADIIYFNKLLIKLENEQFGYDIILDKSPKNILEKKKPNLVYFVIGLIFGLFLSLGIIFFKSNLKNN